MSPLVITKVSRTRSLLDLRQYFSVQVKDTVNILRRKRSLCQLSSFWHCSTLFWGGKIAPSSNFPKLYKNRVCNFVTFHKTHLSTFGKSLISRSLRIQAIAINHDRKFWIFKIFWPSFRSRKFTLTSLLWKDVIDNCCTFHLPKTEMENLIRSSYEF